MGHAAGDLGTYLDEVVYPALFEHLDTAFPEFGFRRRGRYWQATADATRALPGEPRPDRVYCYDNRPWGLVIQGGDFVRFLALVNNGRRPDGPDFVPAVRRLCELARVPFPEREVSPEVLRRLRWQEARRAALDAVLVHAQAVLWSDAGTAARAYLTGTRGFTENEVQELNFGLYDTVAAVAAVLRDGNQDQTVALDAGLLDAVLEGYLLVPWADAAGQPLTAVACWPAKPVPEGTAAKRNLPGEGTRRAPLYFDRALRAGHRDLVAVEGVFDAALLQARGDTRVVAPGGVQITEAQLETLVRRRVRSVTVCWDPDAGGEAGTPRAVDALTRAGLAAYVAPPLPDGLDPDEFLLHAGLDGWKAHVAKAVSGAVYRANVIIGNVSADSPEVDRRRVVDEVLAFETTLRGPHAGLDHDDVVWTLAERTGYSRETLDELAETVAAKRQREEVEKALQTALRAAQDDAGTRPALEVVRNLSAALEGLKARTVDAPPPFSVERLEAETRAVPEGLSSGFAALDRLGVSFNAGELAVLGARTGHAKTTMLVSLLRNWLRTDGDGLVVFYSAEEAEVRVFHRLLALLSTEHLEEHLLGDGWTANEVRDFLRIHQFRGSWRDQFRGSWPCHPDALAAARETLRGLEHRLLVVHRPSWSVDDIVAHARTLAEREPVVAALVDYLQRIPPPAGRRFDRRDLEVAHTARSLRELALAVKVPVVVGAQINREAVKGEDIPAGDYEDKKVQNAIRARRPKLHHLREGGSEQEADLVLGLLNYRADFEQDEDAPGEVPTVTRLEVGLLKSRYGPVGTWAVLAFEGRFGLVRDPAQDGEV